jgi:hypothetical protein
LPKLRCKFNGFLKRYCSSMLVHLCILIFYFLCFQSVRTWQVAPPNYGKSVLTPRELEADQRWAQRMRQKEDMRASTNTIELRDTVMQRLAEFFQTFNNHDSPFSAGSMGRSESEPYFKPASEFSDLMTTWPQPHRHSAPASHCSSLAAALKSVVMVGPISRPAPCAPSFGQFCDD